MRIDFSKMGMPAVRWIAWLLYITFITVMLTVITQVGGIIYLLSRLPARYLIQKNPGQWWSAMLIRWGTFIVLYLVICFGLVPPLAKKFDREPLPLFCDHHIQPLTRWTVLLNRHYVNPELKRIALTTGDQMHEKFPGTRINYLDAGFPFFDRFPLIPHLSHHDGKKLDIALMFKDKQGVRTNTCPSPIGYGVGEDPKSHEVNTSLTCRQKGYWQYDLLSRMFSPSRKKDFIFDEERTRAMINLFARQPGIKKILLEPHLTTRLSLTSNKIRFHGCQAVRHDDHLHVQL